MRRAFFRGLKAIAWLVVAPVLVVILYLGATYVGAMLPADPAYAGASGPDVSGTHGPRRIYLLTTLLHADFAIPVDDEVRARFAFLREAGIPMDNPALEYLIFGWGSRAFYTNTATLADIRPAPTLRAITGDQSVMHITPARDVSRLANAQGVTLPPGGVDRLLDFIEESFSRSGGGPAKVGHPGYGLGDVFYEASGSFHIFRPCNIWVAEGLRRAGVATGAWTPTTHSLLLGLKTHAADALNP